MPEYEYKVMKIPHYQQTFYCSYLANFGWQVQNIQENVDRVVNRSMGFSHTTNYGSFNARTYFPSHTNHANTYGYGTQHGWGSQMSTQVSDVKTSLTITFFRDRNLPYRNELIDAENRFHAAARNMIARVDRENKWGGEEWPERRAVNEASRAGRAILNRKPAAPQPAPATVPAADVQPQPPVPLPSEPASASIREMEVTQNVFQSNQPGLQIRLNFNIKNRKGIECRACAYFFDAERRPLKDVNQRFRTQGGDVSVGSVFKPGFDDSYYNDYILFMPYSELDQPDGERQLGFNVQIYDPATQAFLATSAYTLFRYTQKDKSKRGDALVTPPTVSSAPPKAPTKTRTPVKKESAPAKPVGPAVKQPSRAEFIKQFREKNGWDVMTEDRQLFLDGWMVERDGNYVQAKRTEAQKYYRKALKLNPKESRYWLAVSRPYEEKGEFDQEIEFLRKGLEALPGDLAILHTIASAHIHKAELDQAQSIANEIGKRGDKSSKQIHAFLEGQIAEARQDYKAAIRFYDQYEVLLDDPELKKIMGGINQERCRNLMKAKKKIAK